MDQLTRVKVDPVFFLRRQFTVGGDFHRRHKSTVWRAATSTEQHHMAARTRQGAGRYGIVTRRT
ncbi:Uncharacterised protein [Shigella flexneri]|nr:Uncharacterised protein [Shigella flexneri]